LVMHFGCHVTHRALAVKRYLNCITINRIIIRLNPRPNGPAPAKCGADTKDRSSDAWYERLRDAGSIQTDSCSNTHQFRLKLGA
jgi:hypothetical protein